MRRAIIMLDVTEGEADDIVSVLEASGPSGARIRRAFEEARVVTPAGAEGMTLAFRSAKSLDLGGRPSAITMDVAS